MQQGVSADGIQLAICQGHPYGGSSYSLAAREDACNRFEQMTGIAAPSIYSEDGMILAGSLAIIAILCILGGFVFLKRMPKKEHSLVLRYYICWILFIVAAIAGILSIFFWLNSTYDVRPVNYGPSGLHMVKYERVYSQNEALDTIITMAPFIIVAAVIAVLFVLVARRTKKPAKKRNLSRKSSKLID